MSEAVPLQREEPVADASTRLASILGAPDARPEVVAAFESARRLFLAGERIDMHELAESLGVGRSTLHRWVGSRDELLGEIVRTLAETRFDRELHAVEAHGPARVVEALVGMVTGTLADGHFETWLQREPQRAMRICTTAAGPVQQHLVGLVAEALQRDTGELGHPLPVDRVAYLMVRLSETWVYADQLTGHRADIDELRVALRLLLQLPPEDERPTDRAGKTRKNR